MKRRNFLYGSMGASLGVSLSAARTGNQYIELSFYNLSGSEQGARLEALLEKEHLPMTKRLGIGTVGYFGLREAPESARAAAQRRGLTIPEPGTRIITLTAYDSLSAYQATLEEQRKDRKWNTLTDSLIDQPPAFDRAECWLLRAFNGLPKIEVPPSRGDVRPRIFDLRNAETPNLGAQARKIEMWNQGEIQIFRNCKLNPMFFGETLFGPRMPNFWFMVWFDGPEARDAAWEAFRKDPDWAKMQKDPRYKGATTPRLNDSYLQPLSFSPIR
jgi:hypothetical protein